MIVVCAIDRPRSAIISTRSRRLSLKRRYQRTHRMTMPRSKCRPLNSCSTLFSLPITDLSSFSTPTYLIGHRHLHQSPFYLGRDVKLAHTGMGITKADYAAFMRCLSVTLDTFEVPEPERSEVVT